MKSISVIEAKYSRSKAKAKLTYLWKNTPGNLQMRILNKINLDFEETPIILFYPDSSHWWILTNQRLLIFQNNEHLNINLFNIEKVELTKLFNGEVPKEQYSSIQLYMKSRYFDLDLERGTWPIIYDILRFMIDKPAPSSQGAI